MGHDLLLAAVGYFPAKVVTSGLKGGWGEPVGKSKVEKEVLQLYADTRRV